MTLAWSLSKPPCCPVGTAARYVHAPPRVLCQINLAIVVGDGPELQGAVVGNRDARGSTLVGEVVNARVADSKGLSNPSVILEKISRFYLLDQMRFADCLFNQKQVHITVMLVDESGAGGQLGDDPILEQLLIVPGLIRVEDCKLGQPVSFPNEDDVRPVAAICRHLKKSGKVRGRVVPHLGGQHHTLPLVRAPHWIRKEEGAIDGLFGLFATDAGEKEAPRQPSLRVDDGVPQLLQRRETPYLDLRLSGLRFLKVPFPRSVAFPALLLLPCFLLLPCLLIFSVLALLVELSFQFRVG
mmetsp:Transcript_29791/g.68366  ORF Transcript_29791/g.68366 Transcript_29791/m.68366 type:complete len:298 (+) Transcript_29791:1829-2722(+)